MKIVFMGTPDFAAGCLKALYEAGHEITAVVTQPDRPRGRKKQPMPSPVKLEAQAHNTPLLQPERIRNAEETEKLKEYEADLFVVAAFGQILPVEILRMPPLGCINVHASLLPKYRGAAPIQQAILDGETETGVTIMQMAEGLDTGDILTQSRVPIREDETGGSLFDVLAEEGARLLIETIPKLAEGSISPVPQDESGASYVKMLKKEDGRMDFTLPAKVLERRIRGLDPWPGAFCEYDGKKLRLWKAQVISEGQTSSRAGGTVPGTVIRCDGKSIDLACGQGVLRILELQPEGKKRMETRDYLLGHKVAEGERFG